MKLFNKKPAYPAPIEVTVKPPRPVFVDLNGAMVEMDEDTGKLNFVPRGPISIQVSMIGGYYDNTVLLMGNKIRVMETAAQIALKIMEAEKNDLPL